MQVFGSSGVRGVVGEELTPAFVGELVSAAGATFDADAVAIARDTRTTGRMLADAAAASLAALGSDVHRLGVVPTPGAQSYAARHGVPAVMLTASHNPPAYNGVKLIGSDGIELSRSRLVEVEKRLFGDEEVAVGYDAVGRSRDVDDARRRYLEELLAELDDARERIADADLLVAVDPGHGAGSSTSPEFFRELGCSVVTVNAEPDGRFPGRDPEPIEENLADLRRLVRTSDADLGVAHDGDADRAMFVDERGAHIEGDATLAALAAAELDVGDTVVSAVNVSQRLVDVAAEAGADLELTSIGSTYLITHIQELRAAGNSVAIAGEGNGGIFFPDYRITRDGAYTAARFLEIVAERPASEIAAEHGDYANIRVNLPYDGDDNRKAMLSAAESYARNADAEVTTLDGYRLDYGDAWVLARPSGTEPLVRLYAEARDSDRAESLLEGLRSAMADAQRG